VKFLAIETSSNACSVAVQNGDDIVENHVVKPRQHTKILLPMIREALREAALAPTDLDALILGNGPGSFIGMRIGASVAQGICYGAGLKIVPVSSLAVVAAEAMQESGAENISVAQDARMREVYVGLFKKDSDGLPQCQDEEKICPIGAIDGIEPGSVAAGRGWQKYDELISANKGSISAICEVYEPHAKFLLAIGINDHKAGRAISPENLLPAYLRTKVAEKQRSAS
jgi:tRNA threonylcarbamoyladenosine biosynthesis protein TsaB